MIALSNIPVGASDLFTFLGCVSILLVLWNQAAKALGKDRTPQPLKVEGAVRYARHEELLALRNEFELFRSELRQDVKALEQQITANNHEGEKRAAKIHERISQISENLPQRVVTLLHQTGALRK